MNDSYSLLNTRQLLDDLADMVNRDLALPLARIDCEIDAAMATLSDAEAELWPRQDIRRAVIELIVDTDAYLGLVERAMRDRRQTATVQLSIADMSGGVGTLVLRDTLYMLLAEWRLRDAVPIAARTLLSCYMPDLTPEGGRAGAIGLIEADMADPWRALWQFVLKHPGDAYSVDQVAHLLGGRPTPAARAAAENWHPDLAGDLENPTKPARRLAEARWLSTLKRQVERLVERPVPAVSVVVLERDLKTRTSRQLTFDAELSSLMVGNERVAVVSAAAIQEVEDIGRALSRGIQSYIYASFMNWALRAAHMEVLGNASISNQRNESVEIDIVGGYEELCRLIGVSPNTNNRRDLAALLAALSVVRMKYKAVETPILAYKYHRPGKGSQSRLVLILMGPLHPYWIEDLKLPKGNIMRRLVPVTEYPTLHGRHADAASQCALWDALRLYLREHAQEAAQCDQVALDPCAMRALAERIGRPIEFVTGALTTWIEHDYLIGDKQGEILAVRLTAHAPWALLRASGKRELEGASAGRRSAQKRAAAWNT